MKKEFKVGDRVRIYGSSQTGHIEFAMGYNPKGSVTKIYDNGSIQVVVDDTGRNGTFHPRQLIALKPKMPRVEKWVVIDNNGVTMSAYDELEAKCKVTHFNRVYLDDAPHRAVLLREVRGKKSGGGA